jgi:hypothetical protein
LVGGHLDLFRGQIKAGQAGNLGHDVDIDTVGHDQGGYCPSLPVDPSAAARSRITSS